MSKAGDWRSKFVRKLTLLPRSRSAIFEAVASVFATVSSHVDRVIFVQVYLPEAPIPEAVLLADRTCAKYKRQRATTETTRFANEYSSKFIGGKKKFRK